MGVGCYEKQSILNMNINEGGKGPSNHFSSFSQTHYEHSVIYPSDKDQQKVFMFDVPSYWKATRLLESADQRRSLEQIEMQEINDHIIEIKCFAEELKRQRKRVQQNESQKIEEINIRLPHKNNQNLCEKQEQKDAEDLPSSLLSKDLENQRNISIPIFNNVINFCVIKAHVEGEDCDEEIMQFCIEFDGQKIAEFAGEVSHGRWSPSSVQEVRIELKNQEKSLGKGKFYEPKIKVSSSNLECTIPCDDSLFRHTFPAVKMADMHVKAQPQKKGGNLYFEIERVLDFWKHVDLVINSLESRFGALEEYLSSQKPLDRTMYYQNTVYDDMTLKSSSNNPGSLQAGSHNRIEILSPKKIGIIEQAEEKEEMSSVYHVNQENQNGA